jgi:hypothetical protein
MNLKEIGCVNGTGPGYSPVHPSVIICVKTLAFISRELIITNKLEKQPAVQGKPLHGDSSD